MARKSNSKSKQLVDEIYRWDEEDLDNFGYKNRERGHDFRSLEKNQDIDRRILSGETQSFYDVMMGTYLGQPISSKDKFEAKAPAPLSMTTQQGQNLTDEYAREAAYLKNLYLQVEREAKLRGESISPQRTELDPNRGDVFREDVYR